MTDGLGAASAAVALSMAAAAAPSIAFSAAQEVAIYCPSCYMHVNGSAQWEEHRMGKKHRKRARQVLAQGAAQAAVAPQGEAGSPTAAQAWAPTRQAPE